MPPVFIYSHREEQLVERSTSRGFRSNSCVCACCAPVLSFISYDWLGRVPGWKAVTKGHAAFSARRNSHRQQSSKIRATTSTHCRNGRGSKSAAPHLLIRSEVGHQVCQSRVQQAGLTSERLKEKTTQGSLVEHRSNEVKYAGGYEQSAFTSCS